jgi:hypothetical protein
LKEVATLWLSLGESSWCTYGDPLILPSWKGSLMDIVALQGAFLWCPLGHLHVKKTWIKQECGSQGIHSLLLPSSFSRTFPFVGLGFREFFFVC